MKPTPIGWLAIIIGIVIVIAGGLGGGNIIVMGVGLLAIAAGGSTKANT